MTYLKQRILQNPILHSQFLGLAAITLVLIALQATPASAQCVPAGVCWTATGNNISNTNTGNVGVGTTSPAFPLQVKTVVGGQTESMTPGAPFGTFAITNQGALHGLYFGVGSSGNAWLQVARHDGGTATYDLILQSAGGKVGIGTTAPSTKLHVVGDSTITGNLTVTGNIGAKYQDVAEWVPASEQIPAGTVVVLDASKSNHVISSEQAYDTRVAGVISEQPGISLGERGDGKVLVATTGRVRVKVDASQGIIQIGDLLVTSDKAGLAMKSQPLSLSGVQIHRPGTLIGKALEPLAKGQGEILVLLSLQ